MFRKQIVAGLGLFLAASFAVAEAPKTDKAPIRLTDAQMAKVVAGKSTLNTDPANSPNSCNNGKCSYDNPNGKPIGKPVTGFNN
jgi:hypothetical protein